MQFRLPVRPTVARPRAATTPRLRLMSCKALLCLTALAALMAAAPAARAQSGYTVTFSGGSENGTLGNENGFSTSGNTYTGQSYTDSQYSPLPNTCSGALTAHLAYQPSGPAPSAVIVRQDSTATWSAQFLGAGSCDDGQGNQVTTLYGGPGTGSNQGGTSASTTYKVENSPGSVFTETISPAATVTSAEDPWGFVDGFTAAEVSYTVTPYPVTLNLGGTTPDGNGNQDILIGQHCTASIVGLPTFPTGYNVSYQWSVTGTTFQTWQPTTPAGAPGGPNPNASYYVSGPGPLTNATAGWYWNDLSQATETVSCAVTVTPPTGQGLPFTVTPTQQVTVMVPFVDASGMGGYMKVGGIIVGTSSGYYLQAGPTGNHRGGMDWDAAVITPISPAFGSGQVELVQIVIPNESYVKYSTGVYDPDPENNSVGLDSGYPYGATTQNPSGGLIVPDTMGYKNQDSPQLELQNGSNPIASSAQMMHSFQDTLMYEPPIPLNGCRLRPSLGVPMGASQSQVRTTGPTIWHRLGKACRIGRGQLALVPERHSLPPISSRFGVVSMCSQPSEGECTGGVGPWFAGSRIEIGNSNERSRMMRVRVMRNARVVCAVLGCCFGVAASAAGQSRTGLTPSKSMPMNNTGTLTPVQEAVAKSGKIPAGLTEDQARAVQMLYNIHELTPGQQARADQAEQLHKDAALAFNAGRYDDAVADARQALAINDNDPLGPKIVAQALEAQGKMPEALAAYQALAERGSSRPAGPACPLPFAVAPGPWERRLPPTRRRYLLLERGNYYGPTTTSHPTPPTQRRWRRRSVWREA